MKLAPATFSVKPMWVKKLKTQSLKVLKTAVALIPILVLGLAVHFLHSFFQQHSVDAIWSAAQGIETKNLLMALGLTLVAYFVMTGYDGVGLGILGLRIPYQRFGLTSFMAFGLNNNLGMGGIAGSGIRYRRYSQDGLKISQVLTIIVNVSFCYWLGFLSLGGLSLLYHPLELDLFKAIPSDASRLLGFVLTAQVLSYLGLCAFRKNPIRVKGFEFHLPKFKAALKQVFVSTLDWLCIASVLYVLLPQMPGLEFTSFVAIFCLSQIVTVFTHVPGGIGVLEAMLLHFLGREAGSEHAPALMASLMIFRIIYFFVPLLLSLIAMALSEITRNTSQIKKAGVSLEVMKEL